MQIVQGDQIEWKRGLPHRGGTFHYRGLMEGRPGTVDNFQVSLGRNDSDFVSPRHRHNFDQVRFQIEGDLDFDRDGTMAPGTVGFFPEGAAYGPQTTETYAMTLVVQFGGASGSGYLSREEMEQGKLELETQGTFKDGVFRRHEGQPGKRNLDGYQAIWEHVHGRPMVYPKPRYPQAIMMDPERFDWVPVRDQSGCRERLLGIFTERRTSAGQLTLERGARYQAIGRSLYFVLEGDGRVAGEPLRPQTTVYLDWDEQATFEALGEVKLLFMGFPDLSGLEPKAGRSSVRAAE